MEPRISLFITLVLCTLMQGMQAEDKQPVEEVSPTKTKTEEVDAAYLPAEARDSLPSPELPVRRKNPVYNGPVHSIPQYPAFHHAATSYKHPQTHAPSAPAQPQQQLTHSQLGVSVSSYQPQNTGVVGLLQHPKEPLTEKKAVPTFKTNKPEYYPKESTYATIPEQPIEALSPRFVPDPSRNQIIESISPHQLQQLTMQAQPQPFAVVQHPHGVHMPRYPAAAAGGPYMMMPYNQVQENSDMEIVKYDETEHSFIDRVWGEVMTVRKSITDDFFGGIPEMLRNIWNTIVGAVSSTTSRMFNSGAAQMLGSATARMLGSIDWFEALQLIVKQLN